MLRDSKLSPTFAALAIQFAKSFGFDSRLFCVRFLLFYFYKDVVYHYFNFIKKQLSRLFGLQAESLRKFQFHKGTIKTANGDEYLARLEHFNSIKVQLKLELGVLCVHLYQFQFHKGTIKTLQRWLLRFRLLISIP